jgi:hypothetical protein
MTTEFINKAVSEAKRFIAAAKAREEAQKETWGSGDNVYHVTAPRECGALRRTSMDLTRALAVMRRSS